MSMCHYILFAQAIFGGGLAEIHRAKPVVSRFGGKNGRHLSPHVDVAEEPPSQPPPPAFSEGGGGRRIMSEPSLEPDDDWYRSVWIHSLLAAVSVGLSGVFPLLVIPIEAGPALRHGASAAKLKLLLSFAVGGLLGDVFLHLLPEAWNHLDSYDHGEHIRIGMWVLVGILSFFITEKFFSKESSTKPPEETCVVEPFRQCSEKHLVPEDKATQTKLREINKNGHLDTVRHRSNGTLQVCSTQCEGRESEDVNKRTKTPCQSTSSVVSADKQSTNHLSKPSEQSSIKISGYLNLFANYIDNFTHGLAIAGSFLVGTKVGILTTFAILVHEIPHEIGDFVILLRAGFSRLDAAKAQLVTATGGIAGVIMALCADSAKAAGDSTAWILPFTSGGFIYIALVTVVPDLLSVECPRQSVKQVLCICGGIGAMLLVTLVFD